MLQSLDADRERLMTQTDEQRSGYANRAPADDRRRRYNRRTIDSAEICPPYYDRFGLIAEALQEISAAMPEPRARTAHPPIRAPAPPEGSARRAPADAHV